MDSKDSTSSSRTKGLLTKTKAINNNNIRVTKTKVAINNIALSPISNRVTIRVVTHLSSNNNINNIPAVVIRDTTNNNNILVAPVVINNALVDRVALLDRAVLTVAEVIKNMTIKARDLNIILPEVEAITVVAVHHNVAVTINRIAEAEVEVNSHPPHRRANMLLCLKVPSI